MSESKYAVLQEVSDSEMESWLYFLKYNGNEDALKSLQKQLESVEWIIIEDLSTFDIDLEHLVSAQTAKEMTKIELNSYQWHRKFDGNLQLINLGFSQKDSNQTKICKTCDILSHGMIDNFIDKEDIDPEDMLSDDDLSDEKSDDQDSKYHLDDKYLPRALRK